MHSLKNLSHSCRTQISTILISILSLFVRRGCAVLSPIFSRMGYEQKAIFLEQVLKVERGNFVSATREDLLYLNRKNGNSVDRTELSLELPFLEPKMFFQFFVAGISKRSMKTVKTSPSICNFRKVPQVFGTEALQGDCAACKICQFLF